MRRCEVCGRQVEVTCAFGACAAHHPLDCEPLERIEPEFPRTTLTYREAS